MGPTKLFLIQNWTIHGMYWGSYPVIDQCLYADTINRLLSWLARGLITVNISRSYKLQEVCMTSSVFNTLIIHTDALRNEYVVDALRPQVLWSLFGASNKITWSLIIFTCEL